MPSTQNMEVLAPHSKVWIYQASQAFNPSEVETIKNQVKSFAKAWVSHSNQLKAYGDVLFDRFLILMVDESQAGASGCSIDTSVAFIKNLQAEYGVDFFDRMRFSYQDESGAIHTLARAEFEALYQEGKITDKTLVFDTLVKDKAAFESAFLKPLGESWHARMV